MMTFRNINRILLLLLSVITLTACIDDDFKADNCSQETTEGIFEDGYSLNIVVTLDDMGGTRAAVSDIPVPQELKQWEDYIDPEKFRVLFFNHEDKLLFESKSRWVKKLDGGEDNRWLVSVPVFTYGNDVYDEGEEWPWEDIRKALTSNNFKIAILANRPEMEWYPGFSNTGLEETSKWMDNTGPHWTPKDNLQKDVFDLHHCQYDAIYHGKSNVNNQDWYAYDFITEGYDQDEEGGTTSTYSLRYPQMGALSSWVDWTKKDKLGKNSTILPSQEHPIPMYGIQEFDAISGWQEGTPFNLSDGIPGDNLSVKYTKKSIFLLRSVVRLELLIPKGKKPETVILNYPNLYARCEPMDVWTPTDELWNHQHDNNNEACEIKSIMNYGPVSKKGDPGTSSNDQLATPSKYQTRLSWFYGIWKEDEKWSFNGKYFNENMVVDKQNNYPYPRIFNTCIQRHSVVVCDVNCDVTEYYNDDFYHYVVYIGERNINDPSNLSRMGDSGGGKPTVISWRFNIGDKMYGVPITDYAIPENPALDINPDESLEEGLRLDADGKLKDGLDDVNHKYMTAVMNLTDPKDSDKLPWPLIRNHVYRITLSKRNNTNVVNNWNFAQDINDEIKRNLDTSGNWTRNASNNTWQNTYANSISMTGIIGGDITFQPSAAKSITVNATYIDFAANTSIRLGGLSAGQIITIDASGASTSSSITASNATRTQGPTDNKLQSIASTATGRVMNRWRVNTNGTVTFNISGGNVKVYLIKVTNPNGNAKTRTVEASSNEFMIEAADYHSESIRFD